MSNWHRAALQVYVTPPIKVLKIANNGTVQEGRSEADVYDDAPADSFIDETNAYFNNTLEVRCRSMPHTCLGKFVLQICCCSTVFQHCRSAGAQ